MRRLLVSVVVGALAVLAVAEEPKGALVVRARMPDGAAVSGAVVEARILTPPPPETWGRDVAELYVAATATTNAIGEARLSVSRGERWRVEVRAPGRATAFRILDVDPKAEATATLRLAEGASLEGGVCGLFDEPRKDVVVFAGPIGFEGDWAQILAQATTDAHGRWRLSGLPRGPVDVFIKGRVWLGRVAVPGVERLDTHFFGRDEIVGYPAGGPEKGVGDDAPAPQRKARVRVVGPDGKPVVGATVVVGGTDSPNDGLNVWPGPPAPVYDVTGPDGAAAIECAAYAFDRSVVASAPGFAEGRAVLAGSEKSGAFDVEVRLARGRDVVVQVVDGATREGIADAWLSLGPDVEPEEPTVSALPESEQRSDVFVGRTGADGTFVLRDVGPAAVRVHATAEGRHAGEARLPQDASRVVVDLAAQLAISGVVLWEDGGRPAAEVHFDVLWLDHPPSLVCWFGTFRVGPTGRFRVPGLHAGKYEISVYSADMAPGPDVAPMCVGPIRAGAADVVVRVRPGRRFAGRLTSEDGVRPGVCELRATSRPADLGAAAGETRSTSDGVFSFLHAPHGPVFVHVDATEFGRDGRERRVVDVGPIDPKDDVVTIAFPTGLSIDGRLVRGSGEAVAGAFVAVVPAADGAPKDHGVWSGCRTDENGRFHVGGLAAGLHHLWLVKNWKLRGGSSFDRRPARLDPDPGTPVGTKDLTLVWK